MTGIVELRAGAARVVVAPSVGGAIASFDYDGEPVLRRTPAALLAAGAVRGFSCFPLIPFSNRIADATLHWAGHDHRLKRFIDDEPHAIHGNGWQRPWTVTRHETSGVSIELVHDAIGGHAREWPFPYRGQQRFDLVVEPDGVTLELALEIENIGTGAFPFGLGWHPYFVRDAETELGFTALSVWQTDPTRLPTRLDPVPAQWSFDPPRRIGDVEIDNAFKAWQPPAIVRWPARKLAARIGADPTCKYLVVYVPSCDGAPRPYFALEPVTHMTDAFNRADEERDGGTRVLEPGSCFSCTMSLSVSRNA